MLFLVRIKSETSAILVWLTELIWHVLIRGSFGCILFKHQILGLKSHGSTKAPKVSNLQASVKLTQEDIRHKWQRSQVLSSLEVIFCCWTFFCFHIVKPLMPISSSLWKAEHIYAIISLFDELCKTWTIVQKEREGLNSRDLIQIYNPPFPAKQLLMSLFIA